MFPTIVPAKAAKTAKTDIDLFDCELFIILLVY